jgi:hypothetical protein
MPDSILYRSFVRTLPKTEKRERRGGAEVLCRWKLLFYFAIVGVDNSL